MRKTRYYFYMPKEAFLKVCKINSPGATVKAALKFGVIKKLPCQMCAMTDFRKIDAHHHNYSKPIDVIWLCRPCHFQEHRWVGTRRNGRVNLGISKILQRLIGD